jgi:hypothetical protein
MDSTISLAPTRFRQRNRYAAKKQSWLPSEDEMLIEIATHTHDIQWQSLTPLFPGRTGRELMDRWRKVLDPGLRRGSWTSGEDEIIKRFVAERGTNAWKALEAFLPGRLGKQCRERWHCTLDPAIDRSPWTDQEDEALHLLHDTYGGQWSKIQQFMPTRPANALKNRWNSVLSRRLNRIPKTRPMTRLPSIHILMARLPTGADGRGNCMPV